MHWNRQTLDIKFTMHVKKDVQVHMGFKNVINLKF